MLSSSNRSTKLMFALLSGVICWGVSTAAPAIACGRSACRPNLSDITGPNLSDVTGPNLSDITGPNLSDNTGSSYSPMVRDYLRQKADLIQRYKNCESGCSPAEWSELEAEKSALKSALSNIRAYRRW